jgi:hypothetical protein
MTGTEPLIIKGVAQAASTVPKAIPPAVRAVRRILDNRNDRQTMTRIFESAMTSVAKGAPAEPAATEIKRVADGAVAVASTGSVRRAHPVKRVLRRLRRPLGRRHARGAKEVPPFSAIPEIAQWVQMSAAGNEVAFFVDEQRAREVASRFIEMALVDPSTDDAGFSGRLNEAWQTSAKQATEAANLADAIQYQSLAVGATGAAAAAAAGEFFSLSGSQVLAFAAAFGAGFTLVASGIAIEHRRRASKADFARLLNLRREVQDFLVDLAIALMDGLLYARQEKSGNAPNTLEVFRDELDARLLPVAEERAPNLAVHLEQISHQLRLLAQKRPTFDPSALRLAMQAAWQLLEPADSDSSPTLQLAARQAVESRLPSPAQLQNPANSHYQPNSNY